MYKKICVIGEGITSLIITRMLLALDLKVDLISECYYQNKNNNKTLAISRSNMKYLNSLKALDSSKQSIWNIEEINLFSAKKNCKINKIFHFNNKEKKPLFIMITNNDLCSSLKEKLNKDSSLKIYSKSASQKILGKITSIKNKSVMTDYSLIINCNNQNNIHNKYFFKKIRKNYFTTAITSILKHQKKTNNIASQFLTEQGPMAFLPLSDSKTSVVWSIKNRYLFDDEKKNYEFFKKQIKTITGKNLKIISFSKINQFSLNFIVPREYYYENILNFGEALHQIHPLGGQGLNMIIRDIQILNEIFNKNIDLGIDLNSALLAEFSKKTKSYNFLFAKGMDLTEKYMSINNVLFNKLSDKLIKKVNKNIFFKNFLINIADLGINSLRP